MCSHAGTGTARAARPRGSVRVCVRARVHAHGRALVSTQSRVVINFNKTLGVRRDRALCEQEEEEEEGAERERERERVGSTRLIYVHYECIRAR